MKVGDKILCKRTYSLYNKNWYNKGRLYQIFNIDFDVFGNRFIYVCNELGGHNKMVDIINCEGEVDEPWVGFYMRFNNYFYIGQELRKIKLEKLWTQKSSLIIPEVRI